jgi:hypothetical protein
MLVRSSGDTGSETEPPGCGMRTRRLEGTRRLSELDRRNSRSLSVRAKSDPVAAAEGEGEVLAFARGANTMPVPAIVVVLVPVLASKSAPVLAPS